MTTRFLYLFFILITFILSACSEQGISDLKNYVTKIKAEVNPPIEPIPPYKHIPNHYYEVQNQRDPFIILMGSGKTKDRPVLGKTAKKTERGCPISPNFNRVRVGLEVMSLDALEMVGTLEVSGALWALIVSTSDGTIYRVKQRDYMGENYGQVVNISEDKIEILEQLSDGKGCWQPKITEIHLTSN